MSINYCCGFMAQQLNYKCEQHGLECPDIVITEGSRAYEGHEVPDHYYLQAKNATYSCKFCPQCGADLGWGKYETVFNELVDALHPEYVQWEREANEETC